MGIYKHIRADVYRRGITVFMGTRKELVKFVEEAYDGDELLLKQVKDDVDDATSIGTAYKEERGQSLVWVPSFPKTPEQIASLAHEILHATYTLLDFCGVEYRYGGANEPYTYLFEYFLTNTLKKEGYEHLE